MDVVVDTPTTGAAEELTDQELAVLGVLVGCAGRVVSRHELARRTGLTDRSERRCDAILVQIRRALGPGCIRTVRSRGWMLDPSVVPTAHLLLDRTSPGP